MKKLTYYQLATMNQVELFQLLGANIQGFTTQQADSLRAEQGNNEIDYGNKKPLWKVVAEAYLSPFTLILIILAGIAYITEYSLAEVGEKDPATAIIILVLVFISGTMTLVQTVRSNSAAEALNQLVEVTSAIKRDGNFQEIPTEHIVLGDIIHLSAGDMVPADIRLISTKDLFISQTSLTGESYPVEKIADSHIQSNESETSYETIAYMGSEVVSGTAEGVVVRTANDTLFGEIAQELKQEPVQTSFDKGIHSTSRLLIRFMAILAPTVILINGFTKGDWFQALLFGISIAVGLTPEMLPMIVTSNLVKGASSMAKEGTIIRHLSSIQNFGAIDVLCTDKTGTLTQDKIVLQYHLDIEGNDNDRILRHAYLNSYYQTGLKNLMDVAIIEAAQDRLDTYNYNYEKIDEIPFDFNRRRMSVVVQDKTGKTQMITKGAIEEMLSISSHVEVNGVAEALTESAKMSVLETVDKLNSQGLRVLGLSQKASPSSDVSVADESDMVLIGYLAFLDPPKETTKEALDALREHNVEVKILTGDNALVTQSVCQQVGIEASQYLTGEEVASMTEAELKEAVENYNIFVKLNPSQKAELVRILRNNGHVVGFMGDGINDSPAMRAADVGISVDNAVDIAKESADVILLEKDLMVLEKGIISGRKVFGNIMKYINATTSSNFGNMFSVLIASIFLPFLPMLPMQLLFLNLVYDLACMSIPWDEVDEEYLRSPKKWEASSIQRFMIWFGPTSSIFDVVTFIGLFFVIGPQFLGGSYFNLDAEAQAHFVAIFHTGWFIVSLWTQTLVLYALRSPKLPFIESRPSFIMTTITLLGIVIGTLVPFTSLGTALDLTTVPTNFWFLLIIVIVSYLVLVTIVKHYYVKRFGDLL
ncbi:magnesium-translocating P-type ATPase [Aerococcaceae bacterium WGS1372]